MNLQLKTDELSTREPVQLNRHDLHDYQNRAVEFVKDNPRCALWLDMSLGKSIITLTALAALFDRFDVGHALVTAPVRVARATWPEEIVEWAHTRHLTACVITGTPAQRLKLLRDDRSDIHLIGRELIPWLVDAFKTEPALRKKFPHGWPYDMLVIDEASGFKDPKSQRFKALKKVLLYIDRLVELTGTPAGNGLKDIWAQIFLIDRGERLGKTYSRYIDTYFDLDYFGRNPTIKPGAEEKIYALLADICLTLSADDYLDLPERIDNFIEIDLPVKARSIYGDLERDFLAMVDDDAVVVETAAVLSNKLLQCANGALYIDDQRNWKPVHDAKLDALDSIVAEASGTPIFVAYNYKTDVERILKRFPQAVRLDKDPETIKRWNRGEIEMLLAHPASAGHGLNLQHGGRIIVWFGLNWSLELYQQFNARLRRQGQKAKSVIVHHIVARNTVDQTVLAKLGDKDVTQRALLDALKSDVRSRQQ